MLQNIGDKLKGQRWLATLILTPLALIFAVWGAYGIVNTSFTSGDYGLKVDGETVSTRALENAWQQQQAQYAQASGGAEMSAAQKTQLQGQLVDQYVRAVLLRQRAQGAGYRASDAQVVRDIESDPNFQVEGRFDARAYRNVLAQAGRTPESYESSRRDELAVQQLTAGIEVSDFLTGTEMARIYALENEQRELRYVLLPADRYAKAVRIDDAKVQGWFQAHRSDYLTPETAHLRYAELSLDAIASALTVAPADLAAYYDKNKARYSQPEKRHAHHILIAVGNPKDPKAEAAALARAQQVLAELKAGKDFGQLAKQYSADPGSAAQGGDLGWAERSAYVAPFADALFGLQPGQISAPVRTQYGYHIIRLDEVRPAHVQTLEEAHAQIEADYRRDQAADVFGDREEQLQQKIEDGATDLDALARQFDLQTGEVADFTRTSGGAPLGAKRELIDAVFNADALAGGKLGGPVALADDRIVIFRVLDHHAPAPQPLASVREQVIAAIRRSDGAADAKAAANEAVKQLQGGAAFDQIAQRLGVKAAAAAWFGRSDPQLPLQVRDAAFDAPAPAAQPAYRALGLDDGGAAVLMLSAVKPGTPGANPKSDQQLADQYLERDREGDLGAYVLELQRRAEVRRNPQLFQ